MEIALGKAQPAGARLEAIWDEEWDKHLLATALEAVKRQVSDRQFQIFDLHVLQHWPVDDVTRVAGECGAGVSGEASRRALAAKREQTG